MTRALIAEDEPLLAAALASELAHLWPELDLLPTAPDGPTAVQRALQAQPDVLFLDIRMPGCSGLEAAQVLIEDWPDQQPLPLIVFVTAYDQHALEAFERNAVDYVLKPVRPDRLPRTCTRLRGLLAQRSAPAQAASTSPSPDLVRALQRLLASEPPPAAAVLTTIAATVGTTVQMVPVAQVLYFEAADKYVRVVTAEHEVLIRTPLRDLLPQLPPGTFEQVHRSLVVRIAAITTVHRDEAGRLQLRLQGVAEALPVSRLYAHRFKPM
jgi:DNA-binding LytR/AlgR family response regulator